MSAKFLIEILFLENLRKPLTLKSTRTGNEEKQNGRVEGRKPNDSSCRGKPNKHRERKLNMFVTFWRAKNEQKRFSKWARGSSLFWNEQQILGEELKSLFRWRQRENPVNTA